MGMVAVIHKKGAPDNFVWEETKVGSPECGQVRLRSTAVGVNSLTRTIVQVSRIR